MLFVLEAEAYLVVGGQAGLRAPILTREATAARIGGGVVAEGDLTLSGSIVASNTATTGNDLQILGNVSMKYSLVSDTVGTAITSNTGIGNILNADPLLRPRGNREAPGGS